MSDYDVIIIGGGINGASIARDAAMRKLRVLLLEKEDYAWGASSKTSKLAHGGIRYLEGFHFSLVREALQERNLLLKNAAHLVEPLPFIFPVYDVDKRPLWMIKVGMYLYDLLAWGATIERHRNISKGGILKEFPALQAKGLKGGCVYYDAQMDDHRLVIENILSATECKAECWNHTEVTEILHENGKAVGVRYESRLRNTHGQARAKVIVNATGAWSNLTTSMDSAPAPCRVRPTKGVHLIVPRVHDHYALILAAPQDGRIFFLMPWEGESLLGTTDSDFDGDPDNLEVTDADIDYLLAAYAHYFPQKPLGRKDIISGFAGLRPLAANEEGMPSDVSREHIIASADSGLISLVGGKYTTARKVAEQVVDRVIAQAGLEARVCRTQDVPLPHVQPAGEEKRDLEPICEHHPETWGSLRAAIEQEQALTLEDWYYRRTYIGYGRCGGRHCVEKTAAFFAKQLGWSAEQAQRNVEAYVSTLR